MASWRENTSAAAQDDLDSLLDAALDAAENALSEHGKFFPFALVTTRDGHRRMVAVDAADAQQSLARIYDALGELQRDIRAAAVVSDVRLPETNSDAVDVELEHAEGIALRVLEPYRLAGTELISDALEAHSATRRIWP